MALDGAKLDNIRACFDEVKEEVMKLADERLQTALLGKLENLQGAAVVRGVN